jgi:endonuclease YncB( thermonuclease family)
MPKQELTIKTYPVLLSQLKTIFIQGMQKIEEEKVKTYWRTGQIISDYILENKERADYGENLFEKLSPDLGVSERTLNRAVQFYRSFPISSMSTKLNWSHYSALLSVKDKEKRDLLVEKTIKKEWTSQQLEDAVRLENLKIEEPEVKPAQSSVKLSVTRSRLFTYKVLEPSYIQPVQEQMVIDLGFKFLIHTEIKGIRLKQDEIIESIKEGGGYSFKHSAAAPKELYTYKALVEKVVDADTLWLNIDVGFSCWSRQKVRFRGIDAPEIDTKKGQEAKAFVEARLKNVPFIVVKTHKSDKYDRYLTDVFYLSSEEDSGIVLEQGSFLNQELLNNGLARGMED